MGKPEEDDEELAALRAADELLAQEEGNLAGGGHHHLNHHHRRLSSTAGFSMPSSSTSTTTTAPRDLVASLTAVVALSAIATRQIAVMAKHSTPVVAAFPALHFGALGLVGVALGYCKPRGAFGSAGAFSRQGGGGSGGIELGRAGARANRKVMALAGVSSAISMVLRLWATRRNDSRLCDAVDLFVMPTILLALPHLSPRLPLGSPLHSPTPSIFAHTIILTTFMAGFSLIGIYGSSAKLLLELIRLLFEAASLQLLKEGLSDDGRTGEFLMGTVAVATVTSLAAAPLGYFVSFTTVLPTSSILSILFSLVASAASQIAILFSLYLFSSPLTTTGTLFARNLILLCVASLGENGYPIRDNWLQVLFVYAFGTAAVAWSDAEVSSAVRGISSHRDSNSAATNGYSLLNGNGSGNAGNGHLSSPSTSNPGSPSLHPSPSPPAANRKSSNDKIPQSSTSSFLPSSPFLALVPFIPLLLHLLQPPASDIPPLQHACSLLPESLRTAICPTTALPRDLSPTTVDIVISYYDEDLPRVRDHINGVRNLDFTKERDARVIIYNKGPLATDEIRKGMELKDVDEVVPLENLGREGETYLKHILMMYNTTASATPWPLSATDPSLSSALAHVVGQRKTLAAHTFFLQPHLAWDFIAAPRMQLVGPDTGFAHFGPLVEGDCGRDNKVGVDFPLWTQLYGIFREGLCAPGGQTMAWSAQFVVSRDRILANPYHKYAYVDELMCAPKGHWIHNMWGPNESGGPSNPAFGHSVERAWPAMFDCHDRKIAKECPDNVFDREKCTCIDPVAPS